MSFPGQMRNISNVLWKLAFLISIPLEAFPEILRTPDSDFTVGLCCQKHQNAKKKKSVSIKPKISQFLIQK